MNTTYLSRRQKIKFKIRKKIKGTESNPRMVVFRSARNIFVQLIDDVNNRTLISSSSLDKDVLSRLSGLKGKMEKSKELGKIIAEKAKTKNIGKVVFDRNGYLYHGRIKAIAEGAREGGLIF